MTDIQLVVALSDNYVIGNKGQIPWHLSEDLKHFRRITTGHTVVMGRRTFESIGKVLPNRRNIMVSSTFTDSVEGLEVVTSFAEACKLCKDEILMVIGGARMYAEALPFASTLYLTRIRATIEGDTRFPEFKDYSFKLEESETHHSDECGFDYVFEKWIRAI